MLFAIFCGMKIGSNSVYKVETRKLGVALTTRGVDVLYGGGSKGLMGELADKVLDSGGKLNGVIIDQTDDLDNIHSQLSNTYHVNTLSERKDLMMNMCDGFIMLPGGIGTFDEFFHILALNRLGIHNKPIGILNIGNYFNPLVSLIDKMIEEGFLKEKIKKCILIESDADCLVDKMTLRT